MEKASCMVVLSCSSSEIFVVAINQQSGSRSLEKGTNRKAKKDCRLMVQKEEHVEKQEAPLLGFMTLTVKGR